MKKVRGYLILCMLLVGGLMACSSGNSAESDANGDGTDTEGASESNLVGQKYEVVGEDVFTDFEEDRYDGLEIKAVSAGQVSSIPDEIHEEFRVSDSFDGYMLLEVEITNTTDEPISNYEFAITSDPVDDWSDDEEFRDKYITSSESISLEMKSYDEERFEEQINQLEKYKLLANDEHYFLPNSTVKGLHLMGFNEGEMPEDVFIHNTTLKADCMFELEATEEDWDFSDVDYEVDYEDYEEELDKYM